MSILSYNIRTMKYCNYMVSRCISKTYSEQTKQNFEPVFSLPAIKYIAILNRLKVYHIIGSTVALPTCGILEIMNVVPEHTFFSTAYVGLTAAAVLSLVSLPFRNIIGFLYITEDNQFIKISSVDYWGKRKDKIVRTEDWFPLFDLPPKAIDSFYLSPQLSDGAKYKLLVKYGKILNAKKISEVLE
ncbi:transmembrane protein 186 [Amyelois transitella]|uniref:transmembrane protein 186 n=1 Tax=Amyelois transitella TaxID=680683 RepID=UPI00067C322D|nr:transmembrane protein 186 [Amyelois transitella]